MKTEYSILYSIVKKDYDNLPSKLKKKIEKNHNGYCIFSKIYNGVKVKFCMQTLAVLNRSNKCVCCGLEGTEYVITNKDSVHKNFYLSLYGYKDGRKIRMTKDHIIPVKKGGRDFMYNYQTMCEECNTLKKDSITNSIFRVMYIKIRFWIGSKIINTRRNIMKLMNIVKVNEKAQEVLGKFANKIYQDKYLKNKIFVIKKKDGTDVNCIGIDNLTEVIKNMLVSKIKHTSPVNYQFTVYNKEGNIIKLHQAKKEDKIIIKMYNRNFEYTI